MASTTIYPQGNAEFIVPATQSVAISNYGGGIAKIYYLIENVNRPDAYQFQQTLNNSAVTLGAFSVATTVKIEANNSKVIYDVGSSPDTGIGDADTLNGLPSDTADTASTIAARDSSGDIAANAFESTVTTGTAPLTVASTTAVANLNADQTDGYNAAEAATVSTLAARDASGDITANAFESTVATGTAPFVVASTTVVPNLNSGRFDSLFSSQFVRSDTEDTIDAGDNASPFNLIRSSATSDDISFQMKTDDGGSGVWVRYLGKLTTRLMWATSDDLSATGMHVEMEYPIQGAPTAKTTDDTLTAAEIAARIITVNNGAAGTTTLTLPTGSDMDTGFLLINQSHYSSVDFYVINISTVAGEDATIATNTGWTLVGEMTIEANDSDRANTSAKFRARKTAAATWTLYRLS